MIVKSLAADSISYELHECISSVQLFILSYEFYDTIFELCQISA